MTSDPPSSHDHSFRLPEGNVTVEDPSLEGDAGTPEAASVPDRPHDRAPSSSDPGGLDRFQAGDRISQFEIREEVGRGGMGVVYRAWDRRLEREVALKFLPAHPVAQPESKERFLREARAASALDHPHVGTVHEIGETARGELFLVMSYYPGHSLEDQLRRGPLPLDTALSYAEQIAQALDAAHIRGLIHRDVKPSNVLIPENESIKLVDFGLARWISDSNVTEPGRILGTVSYMSPEQIRGDRLDERSDLWALGVVLYEMLSGSRPFTGRYEHALMYAIAHEDPLPIEELRPDLPDAIIALLDRALAKDPKERFGSAGELLAALRRLRTELRASPLDLPLPDRAGSPRSAGSADPLATNEFQVREPRSRWWARLRTRKAVRPRLSGRPWSVRAVATGGSILLVVVLGWLLLLSGIGSEHTPPSSTVPPGSRVAVLALPSGPTGAGPADPLIEDLATAITHLLTRLDPVSGLDLKVVPATEMSGVSTVTGARARFGVAYVLTLVLRPDRNRAPRLHMTLVDAADLDQLHSLALALHGPAGETDEEQLGAAVAGLFGVSLTPVIQRTFVPEDGVDPGARRYYELGRAALERATAPEDLQTATRLFHWAAEADEEFVEAHAALAEAYLELFERSGDSTARHRAQEYAERARSWDGPRPSAHLSRGLLATSRGDYREALLDFKIAATLDSTLVEAHRGMGRALESQGRHELAEAAYRRAVENAPQDWRSHRALGHFLVRTGRFEEAATAYRSVTRQAPESGAGYVDLGSALFYEGRLAQAEAQYERALSIPELNPVHRYQSLSNLGTLYYYGGRAEAAGRAFEAALAIDSTDHRVWGNLGAAYRRQSAPDEAVRAAYRRADRLARRSLAVNPHQPDVLIARAEYLHQLGRSDDTRELITRALDEASGQVHVLFAAGHLYELMGDRARASALIASALEGGYPRWVIERDPKLAGLRNDPTYDPLSPPRPPQPEPIEVPS